MIPRRAKPCVANTGILLWAAFVASWNGHTWLVWQHAKCLAALLCRLRLPVVGVYVFFFFGFFFVALRGILATICGIGNGLLCSMHIYKRWAHHFVVAADGLQSVVDFPLLCACIFLCQVFLSTLLHVASGGLLTAPLHCWLFACTTVINVFTHLFCSWYFPVVTFYLDFYKFLLFS